jgi:predicted aspartyl protease
VLSVAAGLLAAALSAAPAEPSPSARPVPAAASFATPPPVDGLTVADILAKARAASGTGKTVDGEVSVWHIHRDGLDGTTRTLIRGHDYISTTQLGSSVTALGSMDGKFWNEDANGQIIIQQSEPADADAKPVAQKLTHVASPLDAYEVETIAANGSSRRRFYDARTFLLVRIESTAFGTQSFTAFENFVTDSAGRTRPRHIYGGDQRPNNDWDELLVSDDLAATVEPAAVAIPANRRTLVEFPKGRTMVRLPARMVHGAIVVRVQIGSRGLDFLLDSGADSIVVDAAVASELGLKSEGQHTTTIAGNVASSTVKIPEMKIGDLTLHDVTVDEIPYGHNVDADTKVLGLLGFDFFAGAAVTIDYAAGTVEATAPNAFVPDPAATEVVARLNLGVPEVSLHIGPASGDRFVLDTGAQRATIVIFQHFVRLNAGLIPDSIKSGSGGHFANMIGGTVESSPVRLNDVGFGPWRIPAFDGLVARSPASLDRSDGLIGSDFLSFFRITLDESHGKLYVTPLGDLPLSTEH